MQVHGFVSIFVTNCVSIKRGRAGQTDNDNPLRIVGVHSFYTIDQTMEGRS